MGLADLVRRREITPRELVATAIERIDAVNPRINAVIHCLYEDAVKALALACRAIALACVGVNGESNLGFDLSNGAKSYTYFTAPAGHTFIWRLFHEREEAVNFLSKLTGGEKKAVEWAESIPLSSSKELKSYH